MRLNDEVMMNIEIREFEQLSQGFHKVLIMKRLCCFVHFRSDQIYQALYFICLNQTGLFILILVYAVSFWLLKLELYFTQQKAYVLNSCQLSI